jgi:hypothetical protein
MSPGETRHEKVTRVANRAKREMLVKLAPLRWAADQQHQYRVRQYEGRLSDLGVSDRELVQQLHEKAIAVTTLDALGISATAELKKALDCLVRQLVERTDYRDGTMRPTTSELLSDPVIWQWGLQERLLDIVENYLQMPARYYGADVRREDADGIAFGVRQWHRDVEDRNVVKILVWLNDVDQEGGPYAHLSLEDSRKVVQDLKYVGGFVRDDTLCAVTPEESWHTCPGPKWTTIIADNARLFHRATPPRSRDRLSVTFTWTTRFPVKTMPQEPWTPEQILRIRAGLTERQLACLPPSLGVRKR